ncbi:glycoside hydrolase family 27 protein [Butyrivibrio sp. AE3006]|uniref:glycoside hydrolase family 27 protein n=1 Tax=Butyrivibrio sp. AE3006 TaxID=1280673 RepID=UPI0004194EBC|nr:glycoside hydrolase family 27 protein [Butyrivibrio sp. AE3006]
MKNSSLTGPDRIPEDHRYDRFDDGQVLYGKKQGRLPAMGWNSWNAFGSGNTEALTKAMADKIKELSLDELGYKYLVLDDGCYKDERAFGRLSNDEEKFPGGFKVLADYIHGKDLKFGMYNDIGTNLCAGAAVGTCGHEKEDAESYVSWDVDFLKVDNCYYLWDNATFSKEENAKYVYAPAITKVLLCGDSFEAGINLATSGNGIKTEKIEDETFFTFIGTFDGTGPAQTPVGAESGELFFDVDVPSDGEYELTLRHVNGAKIGTGSWLQIATGEGTGSRILFDDFIGDIDSEKVQETTVKISLSKGQNRVRLMNHRRQENTLYSYARLKEGLYEAAPDNEMIYSLCEWGKTQPQNWAKKVGDSWRILNDITFNVGSDGNPGKAAWTSDYTTGVTSQYNKCVVMDEFAGLDKGWNDPDMMVIGMDGLDLVQNRTHMVMWCMMNSPLMLGLDLRRVNKGDELYNIIANKKLIALNQDRLGIQAKRVFCSLLKEDADKEYVTNNDRVDILAKPLSDGSVALSFINLSDETKDVYSITKEDIVKALKDKLCGDSFEKAGKYTIEDLWTGEVRSFDGEEFKVDRIEAFDNVTIKVIPEG